MDYMTHPLSLHKNNRSAFRVIAVPAGDREVNVQILLRRFIFRIRTILRQLETYIYFYNWK
jgi:hypothetical protein